MQKNFSSVLNLNSEWINYGIVRSKTRMTSDQVHPGYIYLWMLRTPHPCVIERRTQKVEDGLKKMCYIC